MYAPEYRQKPTKITTYFIAEIRVYFQIVTSYLEYSKDDIFLFKVTRYTLNLTISEEK